MLPNDSSYVNSKIRYLRNVVDVVEVHVAVNNIKVFSVALEMPKWVPFRCFRATKYFAQLSTLSKWLGLPVNYPIFFPILTKSRVSRQIFVKDPPPPISNFGKICSMGVSLTYADGQRDRDTHMTNVIGAFSRLRDLRTGLKARDNRNVHNRFYKFLITPDTIL